MNIYIYFLFSLKKRRKKEISPRDPFVRNIFSNQDRKDKVVGLGQLTLFRLFIFYNQRSLHPRCGQSLYYLFIYLFIK